MGGSTLKSVAGAGSSGVIKRTPLVVAVIVVRFGLCLSGQGGDAVGQRVVDTGREQSTVVVVVAIAVVACFCCDCGGQFT